MAGQGTDAGKVRTFMRFFARETLGGGRVYLVGGASAVLIGWRATTVDVDLKLAPAPPGAFEAIALAKNRLNMNVELAAPDDFVPALPDWPTRSPPIVRHGQVDFFHYDFHGQALAKIERGHAQDRLDVAAMAERGLVAPNTLLALFDQVHAELLRYPAIDAACFRRKVRAAADEMAAHGGG